MELAQPHGRYLIETSKKVFARHWKETPHMFTGFRKREQFSLNLYKAKPSGTKGLRGTKNQEICIFVRGVQHCRVEIPIR